MVRLFAFTVQGTWSVQLNVLKWIIAVVNENKRPLFNDELFSPKQYNFIQSWGTLIEVFNL